MSALHSWIFFTESFSSYFQRPSSSSSLYRWLFCAYHSFSFLKEGFIPTEEEIQAYIALLAWSLQFVDFFPPLFLRQTALSTTVIT